MLGVTKLLHTHYAVSSDPNGPWATVHPFPTSDPLDTLHNFAALTQTYGGGAASYPPLHYILSATHASLGKKPSPSALLKALRALPVYCKCSPTLVGKYNARKKIFEMVPDLNKCICDCLQKVVLYLMAGFFISSFRQHIRTIRLG